jgi:DNA polymerase elongation subunit (family B)
MGGSIFPSYKAAKSENESYEGAFVFEPIPGVYTDGIATVDYNSLYPSTIRALNISPETYVGKISTKPIIPGSDEFKFEPAIELKTCDCQKFYILAANGQQKTLTRVELDELLDTKCIFTRNNTLMLKHEIKRGVIAEWCAHFFNLRKATKKEKEKYDKMADNKNLSPEELAKIKEIIGNLDSRQQAIKIMINSIYGMIGTAFSPIYNIHLAQTITRTGKFCNISAAEHVAEVFNEKFGDKFSMPPPPNLLDIVGHNKKMYICSGDTDSAESSTKVYIRR